MIQFNYKLLSIIVMQFKILLKILFSLDLFQNTCTTECYWTLTYRRDYYLTFTYSQEYWPSTGTHWTLTYPGYVTNRQDYWPAPGFCCGRTGPGRGSVLWAPGCPSDWSTDWPSPWECTASAGERTCTPTLCPSVIR